MRILAFTLAGLVLWSTALPTDALAMSLAQAYKSCRADLRGIGRGRAAPQRRFNMIEHCVRRKLGRVVEAAPTAPNG
jgi:hypothetical protein